MTAKQQLANDIINAVQRYRIEQHLNFKAGITEAIRILDQYTDEPAKKGELLSRSEYLDAVKANHRFPIMSFFKRRRVAK